MTDLSAAAEREVEQPAQAVLDQAQSIRNRTDDDVLTPCRTEIERIRNLSTSADRLPEYHSLASGAHPLAVLVHIVKDLIAIPDDELTILRAQIADAFGADVATYATRGQLELLPHPPVPPSPPTPDRPDPAPPTPPTPTPPPAPPPGVPEDQATDSTDPKPTRVQNAITSALHRGLFGLAYHLADVAPKLQPTASAVALVATNYVTDDLLTASDVLPHAQSHMTEVSSWKRGDITTDDLASAALSATACLAPAGLLPAGPPSQLLESLATFLDPLPSLRILVKTVADVSMHGLYRPFETSPDRATPEHWTNTLEQLQRDSQQWISAERSSKLPFQPATAVWHRILDTWQTQRCASIGHLFDLWASAEPATIDSDAIATIVDHWRENAVSEIDRIDRSIRRLARRHPIQGTARRRLLNKVGDAIDFADCLRKLLDTRPAVHDHFHTSQLTRLRQVIRNNGPKALEELQQLDAPLPEIARLLTQRYFARFDHGDPGNQSPARRLPELLHGDLYADPSVCFDDNGSPILDSITLDGLLRLAEEDDSEYRTSLLSGILERAHRGDLHEADNALDVATRAGRFDEHAADDASRQIDAARMTLGVRLRERVHDVTRRLDQACLSGVLTQDDFELLCDELPSPDLTDDGSIPPRLASLDRIDAYIDGVEQKLQTDMRQRLNTLKHGSPDHHQRVDSAISKRSFQVAEDYLERLESGDPLPNTTPHDPRPFDAFFPTFVEEYAAFTGDTPAVATQLVRAVRTLDATGPVDARDLSNAAATEGARLLEAWFSLRDRWTPAGLKRGSVPGEKLNRITTTLRTLLNALGFSETRVQFNKESTTSGAAVFDLRVHFEPNARIAQLPVFGSRAAGQYRLLVVPSRSTHEAIIAHLAKWSGDDRSPNIAVFLNPLDVHERRELASELRSGSYHPTLVLDEALAVFLAIRSSRRLAAFFDCASAFAVARPFDPDAPSVPQEMFFGREAARGRILAMHGDKAHLVYGGRRLGKTALLLDIEREYKSLLPDKLIMYLSLKRTGIGPDRPTDELWKEFGKRLAKHDVVRSHTSRHDSIGKGVQQWLEGNNQRRILFLVDEADAFLEAECKSDNGSNYRVLEQIKHVMDVTQQRFKVVFAGLHNVQRAARDPNTPFAQLGEPVQIGPMWPDTDRSAIENLIRRPLETLGYRFISTDDVVRIAAETNYYPALAQQFCKDLLRELRTNGSAADVSGPPYDIRSEAVDRVFSSRETRDRIRNLFSWTIELDTRYEFLTYLIARKSFGPDDMRPQPVSVDDIRTTALGEWRHGFEADPSFAGFETLLEEMVGLGILRTSPEGGFAIRSRNLRTLLGSDGDIQRRFEDAKQKLPPPIFEGSNFRFTLADGRLSALTARQEKKILSRRSAVALIFGTRLAGVDKIEESLRRADRRDDVRVVLHEDRMVDGSAALMERLREVAAGRRSGINLVLVDARGGWDCRVIEDALAFVDKLEAVDRIIRPVFVGGAAEAWTWLEAPPSPRRTSAELCSVWLGPCTRNFARVWLSERDAQKAYALFGKPDDRSAALWAALVEAAAGSSQLDGIDQAIAATLEKDGLVSDILDVPQAAAVLKGFALFADPGEAVDADNIAYVAEAVDGDFAPEQVPLTLDWATRLGILSIDDGYRLDATYAEGLRKVFET